MLLANVTYSTGSFAGIIVAAVLLSLVAGLILGFIITRTLVKKQLKNNPPISEKQIRAMYMSMGRKPAESDIRKTMNAMKKAK
ncbi:YneF family protein [Vibrio harveyi]|nr:YneF family protein [Vibrio harveyi]